MRNGLRGKENKKKGRHIVYWGTILRRVVEFSAAMVEARRQRNLIIKVQKKRERRKKKNV